MPGQKKKNNYSPSFIIDLLMSDQTLAHQYGETTLPLSWLASPVLASPWSARLRKICPLFHDWLTQPGPLGGQVRKLCSFFQVWYLQDQPGLGVTGQGNSAPFSMNVHSWVSRALWCQARESVTPHLWLASQGSCSAWAARMWKLCSLLSCWPPQGWPIPKVQGWGRWAPSSTAGLPMSSQTLDARAGMPVHPLP